MSSQQNNQNQAIFTVQSLDLNFSKKKRNKTNSQLTPCTDRKYSIAVLQPQPIKTQRSVLIEKKKNYSQAIRERNQILLVKKRHETSSSKFVGNEENQQNKGLFQIKQNMNVESAQLRNVSRLQNRSQKSNAKIRSGKKASLVNVSSLDFDAIPHRLDSTLPCFQHSLFQNSALFSPRQRDIRQQLLNSPKFQAFEKQKSPQRQKQTSKITKLKICSNEVSEKVIVLDSDATLLAKQNATFKKDLANFRKQNSVLRKELQDAKNHISELEQRAKNLLQDSLLKTPKLSLQIPDIPEPQHQPVQIINSQQIIQKLRTQIAELKNINSSLQLRTYMAEKKVTQQVTSIKKKMAKQLHDWRDKCTKLRAQNMKYKKIRDMTISMEISKDQQ